MSTTPSRRHSRRSTASINFTQMSVSPLTSSSITEHDFHCTKPVHRRSGSYIAATSGPSTPGILSRTHSFHSSSGTDLSRSKSNTHIPRSSSREWLHRTGAALTSDARESKGQGWLSTRASSTSLVRLADADEEHEADDEFSPQSPMWGHREEDEEFGAQGFPFGLGQFVDRWVGWSLFAESDTESEGEQEEEVKRERVVIRRAGPDEERLRMQRLRREQQEDWRDPAVILSLASSILF